LIAKTEVDMNKPDCPTVNVRGLLLAMVVALIGLHAPDAFAQAKDVTQTAAPQKALQGADLPADYVIGAEDQLGIVFWRDADMSADVTVRPDGVITLPLIGDLRVVGLAPDALRLQIQNEAAKYVNDANVTVVVKQVNSRKVFITGQVTRPGEYPLTASRNVMQIIALAGGLTEYADAKNIKIMRGQSQTTVFKFNYREVERGKNLPQNIQLKPGDTLIVP
jgi:polysaccharide export outer membrane protein